MNILPHLLIALTPQLSYHWSTHTGSEAAPLVVVLEPEVLNALQRDGFSLGETLGGSAPTSNTHALYQRSARYKAFADTLGKPIAHDPKTDQLPQDIPPNMGDIPQMVRLIRGFEDKGARSKKDLKGGFFIRQLSNNSQHPYAVEYDGDEPRHFDQRWLRSKHGAFQLIAVVNRIDRQDFDPSSCGELRFVYRLSYSSRRSRSSMPFLLNVVHQYPKAASCAGAAKRWMIPPSLSKALREGEPAKLFSAFLKKGPLGGTKLKQLEVNFQSLRFTSGYMHDLGGQAMYMQRIFRDVDGRFAPIPLENTPDVLAVRKKPELLERFVKFLARPENLRALDEGRLLVDFEPRFLAKRSISWSTLGRARLANKPYRQLFAGKEAMLEKLDLSGLEHLKSREAVLERLDNLTCMGCHQMGGTAGFHMLGFADPKFSHGFNKQALPYSPHVFAELGRRRAYVQAVASGRAPNRFRQHSVFGAGRWPKTGAPSFEPLPVRSPCVIGSHFAGAPGCGPVDGQATECRRTVSSDRAEVIFGECTMKRAPTPAHYFAGGVCFQGELREALSTPSDRPAPTANFYAFQDKLKLAGAVHKNRGRGKRTARYSCASPKSGAPLGRRGRACTEAEETFAVLDGFTPKGAVASTLKALKAGRIPAEICANQGGNGFDMCAARGDSGACLQSRVARAMLDTCGPGFFCRDDYICQQLPAYNEISRRDYGRKKRGKRVNKATPDKVRRVVIEALSARNIGFCVPTYFLFNMRVDGHPSPVTGRSVGKPKYDRSQPLRGYK